MNKRVQDFSGFGRISSGARVDIKINKELRMGLDFSRIYYKASSDEIGDKGGNS